MDLALPILNRFKKKQIPNIEAGDVIRVHQKISEGGKERVQVFEGIVIAKHRKNSLDATFTVRKIASGVGVERTYLIHSPNIVKIEFKRSSKVRRAKLYYLRDLVGKALRMKDKKGVAKDNWELVAEDKTVVEASDEDIAEAVEADKVKQEEAEKAAETVEGDQTFQADETSVLAEEPKIGGEPDDGQVTPQASQVGGQDNQTGKEIENNDEQADTKEQNESSDGSSKTDQTDSGDGEGDKEEPA